MKKLIILMGCLIFLVTLGGILYGTGIWNNIQIFFDEYIAYVNGDIERQAKLLESIVGGLCAGGVTFGALFITMLHENKKDRIFWERERQKAREERLLSVRPFLNIEIKSVSVSRMGKCDEERDFVEVDQGKRYQYAHVVLSNHGYGKCRNIMIDGHECSINQLDKDQEKELDIFFKGLEDNIDGRNFEMIFIYDDIFGNSYLQQFGCYLKSESKELVVEMGEPLLRKGEE